MIQRLLLLGVAAVCLAGVALAQVPPQAVPAAPPTKEPAPTGPVVQAPDAKDAQDLVYFGEARPILLRLHIQIDGQPYPLAWDEFIRKLFGYYDLNGDGVLTEKETSRIIPGQVLLTLLLGNYDYFNFQTNYAPVAEIDTNKDGKITREELTAYYRKAGAGSLRAEQNPQGGKSGQLTTSLFRHLDLNKDGKLSPEELAAAPVSLRKLDLDEDEMIAAAELLPQQNQYYEFFGGNNMNPGLPESSQFGMLVPGSPLAKLTQQLLNRYDKDKNKKLSAEEIGLDKEAFDALDANHDGQLDATELNNWFSRPADLEMIVRLGQPAPKANQSIFAPLLELGKMLAKETAVDVFNPSLRAMPLASSVKKEGDGLVLTVSDAQIDWQRNNNNNNMYGGGSAQIKQFYLQQFAQLDKDKKGYVDRKQVEAQQQEAQFLRGIFNLADRDGDGKLYEKELSAFLDLESIGAAACTSLRVADNGRGLFELLDADGDGRLSVRELRTAWARLQSWDRNHDGLLALEEVPKQFQITLSQGTLQYPYRFAMVTTFARMGRGPAQPKGPAWFRKMDRNNDGDVSLREWLGTEEEFRRIDTDGDGLISAEEAERYEATLKKEEKPKP
jgi:Ca2+-binding EF-hand superfamily protein